jgi:hypothetical protein
VTNPGDRQAMPTSWMPKLSRADMGTAEAGLLALERVFLDKSNRRGRGFIFDSVGDPGSFLTIIFGRAASLRWLEATWVSKCCDRTGENKRQTNETYGAVGDDFEPEEAPVPLGLRLSPFL